MNARVMKSIRPDRIAFSFAIALLALAMGARCDSANSLTGGEHPTPSTGTIRVTVIVRGSPIGADATVRLTGPAERTTTAAVGTTSTITDLPPGSYDVTATISGGFIDCQSVSANLQAGETAAADIICTRRIGTITGTVIGAGAPISDATVRLTGSGVDRTATTGRSGTFTFTALTGEYTVTTFSQHFVCPVRTVLVEVNQTMTADISCAPKSTGTITGTVTVGAERIHGTTVNLTGPATRTATADEFGSFAIDELPPGTYTVAAIPFGADCHSVSADVQAAQTTTVQISCTFRPPIGSEIEGGWSYYDRLLRSQTGTCPPSLPETGTGSMTFNSSNNTIEIVGLDPELTIIGPYDKDSGSYAGTGAVVLGDGSSIQTNVSVTFGVETFEGYYTHFYTDATPSHVMTRRHRDPGRNLVCTEIYGAGGAGGGPWGYDPWGY
jgi:hypothetical protein